MSHRHHYLGDWGPDGFKIKVGLVPILPKHLVRTSQNADSLAQKVSQKMEQYGRGEKVIQFVSNIFTKEVLTANGWKEPLDLGRDPLRIYAYNHPDESGGA